MSWHTRELIQCPACQTSRQHHPGLLNVPSIGVCYPGKVFPPVSPVLITAGGKPIWSYRTKSEHSLLSIERISRCHCSLCNQLSVLIVHRHRNCLVDRSFVLLVLVIPHKSSLQLQSRIAPTQERPFKRGGIHIISRPVLLAISHRRNMFLLVLRSAGQPIPSTVHNPIRVDLLVGCSVLYCAARPVIRALPIVSHTSIKNWSQQQFQ